MQLSGAVALITGASRGLGFEIALAYLKGGARVAITARDQAELRQAAQRLRHFGRVLAVAGDIADETHVRRLVDATVRDYAGIDILVNNASELGPSPMPALKNLSSSEYGRILAVNAIAPLHLAQTALPYLSRSAGLIINVSSDAGLNAYPNWGGYGSSKAALEHWSRILAEEIKDTQVRIFVVDPGDMDTHMHRLAEPGVDLSLLPKPDVVAPAFVQLLHDPRRFARVEAQKTELAAGPAS